MTAGGIAGREVVLETDRLLLRPWRVAEAVVQRELWVERDPRVPRHRRIDAGGRPSVAELEEAIRAARSLLGHHQAAVARSVIRRTYTRPAALQRVCNRFVYFAGGRNVVQRLDPVHRRTGGAVRSRGDLR